VPLLLFSFFGRAGREERERGRMCSSCPEITSTAWTTWTSCRYVSFSLCMSWRLATWLAILKVARQLTVLQKDWQYQQAHEPWP